MPNTVRIKIYKNLTPAPTHDLGDIPWYAGMSALQAMVIGEAMYAAANFEFAVRYRSIYGAYVFSIDGLSDGDQPDHFWMLYLDGQMSNYGASEALIFEDAQKTTSLVEWKYEPSTAASDALLAKRAGPLPPTR